MLELIGEFVSMLEQFAARVEVELVRDPPVVAAYAHSGLVFAAGWMAEDGLAIRVRLDASATDMETLEHVEGGTLSHEAVVQTSEQLAALENILRRSERLAAGTQSN